MASPQMQRFSDIIRENRPPVPPPIPERRRQMEQMQAHLRIPDDVRAPLSAIGRFFQARTEPASGR